MAGGLPVEAGTWLFNINQYILHTDFLLYSLCLSELFKVVHSSKPLGMSSVFYLVAVTGDLSGILVGVLKKPLGER
ncbi:hypothetical protein BLL37_09175 [Pseudomonas azotoformans]|uniref:Uncharacterized protein n=1 Tax=Pseudomonas azotoformans TaxID=47878 RepID=A0A1V2JNN5_PSEAZ|nr:hypothetical protein BFL39_18510 [Pseudomonas azotoformans]ONH47023.1 hypothetical protein BLL37_09175 [Pseudomonas azotoformans]